MAALPGEQVYATLLLNDSYLPGALVLGHSLRDAGTSKRLALFFTEDTVSGSSLSQLRHVYDVLIPVPRIQTHTPDNLYVMNRPDLHSTFTKINLWKQTQFSKIVYVDADVVAYRAPDELFDLPHAFSAAPDIGWPDIFNSGVMVLTPNLGDYYAMLAMAERGISFDGADQGLLNLYFKSTFNRLSFTYNVTPSGHYQYTPAYRHFQSSINMVHFIGANKPWFQGRYIDHGEHSPYGEMIGRWWAVYDKHYRAHEPQPTISSSQLPTIQEHPPAAEHHHHEQAAHHQPQPQQQPALRAPAISLSFPSPENKSPEIIQPIARAPIAPILQQQHTEPDPPADQTWDAQTQPPPVDSKPEAMNFPSTHYDMSSDVTPFVAPARYPSPPKNMWYEVPKTKPPPANAVPSTIFPWEAKQPAPTRSFPDVEPPPPEPEPEPEAVAVAVIPAASPPTATQPPSSDPWSSFQTVNAWDQHPAINSYVERMRRSGARQPKPPRNPSPTLAMPKAIPLKLTDFPTAKERPSLPVTPAPIRRVSVRDTDDDNDDDSKLAAQSHAWNPNAQLQMLATQQSDELLRKLEAAAAEMPSRDLPFGSELPVKSQPVKDSPAQTSTTTPAPASKTSDTQ